VPYHWHALTQFPSIAIEGRWCVPAFRSRLGKEKKSTHWRLALSQPDGADHCGMVLELIGALPKAATW